MRLQKLHTDGVPAFSVRWLLVSELFDEPFRQFAIDTNDFDPAAELSGSEASSHIIAPVAVSRAGQYMGFLAAHLTDRIELLNIGVPKVLRRNGIATALLQFVEHNLPPKLQNRELRAVVPERLLAVQLLLKANGWKAQEVWPKHFVDGDAFLFVKVL